MPFHAGNRPSKNVAYVAPSPEGITAPLMNQTVLLLNGNGTNGLQNNTFLDNSTNNFTITRNGNTTQGTFSPFSVEAGYWSNFFDGDGDFLTLSANSALNQSGNFTHECWIYLLGIPSPEVTSLYAFETTGFIKISISAAGRLITDRSGVGPQITGPVLALNTWHHVAMVRDGSTVTLYLNGTSVGTATNTTNTTVSGTGYIGRSSFDTFPIPFNGYISNLRVTNTAVYTTNFTPPTSPLTAISGTSLLTCQDNRFIDRSSNNFAITPNGDVRVTTFGPLDITTSYSRTVNGGGAYFDGSGDYLTAPNNSAFNFGSGNFTVEAWYYAVGTLNGYNTVAQLGVSGSGTLSFGFSYRNNSTLTFSYTTNGSTYQEVLSSSVTIQRNSWNHIAVTRSGNTLYFFYNGALVSSHSFTATLFNSSASLGIGANPAGVFIVTSSYLSGVRILKGTALYTSSFTAPTSPLTAITNTSLLMNFVDGGIIDSTRKNNLETVGNAQIDTTVKKYGTGALEFDGNGDYLFTPASSEYNFGTGDFTIECWFYLTADVSTTFGSSRSATLFACSLNSGTINNSLTLNIRGDGSTTGIGFSVSLRSNTTTATSFLNDSVPVSKNTWHHVALVRSGTTVTIYFNGVSVVSGTYTPALNLSVVPVKVGAFLVSSAGNEQYFPGYIDDLRVTRGVARYTNNFNPPSSELQLAAEGQTIIPFSILGVGGGAVTSVNVSSWGLQEGDVLFCWSATDGSNVNLPTGFTNGQNGSGPGVSVVWRWSFKIVGAVPDTTVSGLTATGNIVFGMRGIDVTGGTILAETAGSVISGTTGQPNPPSRVLSSRNNAIVLCFINWDNGDGWAASVTPPAGYTLIGAQNGDGRDAVVAAAYLEVTSTGTYDPGAFSASDTEDWVAQTLFLKR